MAKHITLEQIEKFHYDYDGDIKIFIYACLMHKAGEISKQKLKAMFKQTDHMKNTYKSSITDTWYNDERLASIYTSEHYKVCPTSITLTIEELLGYVKLKINKNHNYSIYWTFDKIIKPIIENSLVYHEPNIIQSFCDTLYITPYENFEVVGYCCEDCDGSIKDVKSQQYKEHTSNQYTMDASKQKIFNEQNTKRKW